MRKSIEAKAVSDQDFGVLGFPVTNDGDDDVDSGEGEGVRMMTIQNISYV